MKECNCDCHAMGCGSICGPCCESKSRASLPVGESPKDKLLNELEQMLEDRLPNMTDEEVKAAESACDAIIDRIRARRSGSALGEFPTCPSCKKVVHTSWDAHEDECEPEVGLGESREPLPGDVSKSSNETRNI